MPPSDEDSEHVFECQQTGRVVLGVSLRRLVAEIMNFQDGQGCSVLADATAMNRPAILALRLGSFRPTTCAHQTRFRVDGDRSGREYMR